MAAAGTKRSSVDNLDVPDFHRRLTTAADDLSIIDSPAANTGTGKDTNHAVSPSGGAMLELAENTGVDIIQ